LTVLRLLGAMPTAETGGEIGAKAGTINPLFAKILAIFFKPTRRVLLFVEAIHQTMIQRSRA
jgi:hypothetical protein